MTATVEGSGMPEGGIEVQKPFGFELEGSVAIRPAGALKMSQALIIAVARKKRTIDNEINVPASAQLER